MIEHETYEGTIDFGNGYVEIFNTIELTGEHDHIAGLPEDSYQGWWDVTGQVTLVIKSDHFTSKWLEDNITQELVEVALADDEQIYDWSYVEFEGNDDE